MRDLKPILRGLLPAVLMWAVATYAVAQEPLTPVLSLSSVRAGDLHLSPDGAKLAYVTLSYRWDYRSQLHVIDVATGADQALTPDGKSERAPQWSPDGAQLGFLSNRAGRQQVYVVPAAGDAATALTARKAGVERFRWSPDGRQIAYLAKADDTAAADGPQLADDPRQLPRLWILDLTTQTSHSLSPAGWRIDDFQWRDGGHLLLVATPTPRIEAETDALYSLATGDGSVVLLNRPPQPFDSLTLSPNATQLAVRSTFAKGPESRDLLVAPVQGGAFKALWPAPNLAIVQVRWRDADSLYARVADGFYNRLVRFRDGAAPLKIDLPRSVNSFDVAPNGDIAFVGEDFDHLPDIFIRTPAGDIRQLTHLQAGWDGVRLAPTTIFWTKSFDGTPIEAALVKPAGASKASPSPLVLLVHGGPSSNFTAGYGWEAAWAQMLATHGYAVLMVNPRGSNGYSEAFMAANRADWGGGDFKDLMGVLDAVIAKGEVDPDSLGVGGWSYGGEMAAWAITQTHRFKAAVAGAPVYDQQAEFETEGDGSGGDDWWFGTPWDRPEVYARNSPATYIKTARTPTLVLDGEDDVNNPVGQSKGLYRALKRLGVETELVTYPGEGHSPRLGSNNIDMFGRILSWYDRHLKGSPSSVGR